MEKFKKICYLEISQDVVHALWYCKPLVLTKPPVHSQRTSIKILTTAIAWMKQDNHLLQQANARVESRNPAISKMDQFF